MIMITNEVLDGLMARSVTPCGNAEPKKPTAKEITADQAQTIYEARRPIGKFFFRQNRKFIGIDNSTGDVLTDVFDTAEDCLTWLET